MEKQERQALLNKADSKAYAALRESNQSEFNELKKKFAAELGVEWTPRKSKEERAREQIAALLREHPDVRAELVSQIEAQIADNQVEAQTEEPSF